MRADLHIHTNFSPDGQSSPQQIVEAAMRNGIDCICITDHDEIKGAIEAMKAAHDKNILVIPGIEVVSKSGDVLGINVKKIVPGNLSLGQTVAEIQKQGGLAVIPHPFSWPRPFGFWGGEAIMIDSLLGGVEVFNASVIFDFANQKAFDFSEKNNFSRTAGSDAHRAEFVGRGYLEIPGNVLSEKDVVSAIIGKKVQAKGRHLNFFELMRNGSKGSVGPFFRYYKKEIKHIILADRES